MVVLNFGSNKAGFYERASPKQVRRRERRKEAQWGMNGGVVEEIKRKGGVGVLVERENGKIRLCGVLRALNAEGFVYLLFYFLILIFSNDIRLLQ